MKTSSNLALQAGKVWLVGAGPGDPELLTLKAARLMAHADAIVHDHLIGDGILELARPAARRIYVGKERSRHTLPQAAISALLVDLARQGLAVIRLKGGDPFIFGRGGEELEALVAAGIPFEVVPGVTAAAGCAAYAGFPLTHRDHAQSLVFVTGHRKEGGVHLDWPALARSGQTLVFYMGVGGVDEICRQLIRHGLPADTPAAVVRRGTLPDQQTLFAALAGLPERIRQENLRPPALIVIGSVVRLHARLAWFTPEAIPPDQASLSLPG
ncbi:MAG: uroporphyrinogen-III C-methyltransferase [Zoogloeaceae bacterium]|jgi:uroporphyrin-III C-methyltransferase|nr:uroporphyrinogen-III C-methyltransferase [Zoogloeaceae bacterium]